MKQKPVSIAKAELYKPYNYSSGFDAIEYLFVVPTPLKDGVYIIEFFQDINYIRLMAREQYVKIKRLPTLDRKGLRRKFFNSLFTDHIDTNEFITDEEAIIIIAEHLLKGKLI